MNIKILSFGTELMTITGTSTLSLIPSIGKFALFFITRVFYTVTFSGIPYPGEGTYGKFIANTLAFLSIPYKGFDTSFLFTKPAYTFYRVPDG